MSRLRIDWTRPSTWLTIAALLAIGVLIGWTFVDLGVFDLWTMVSTENGAYSVINTFASVDHPFHATRAQLLLDSLQQGELLRWIPSHQGGYPVEFYPLGAPWLEVVLWAAMLGQIPIIAVHKIAVAVVFVLPVVGFWILARGDRLNPFVPVLALAIHVAVPGEWTNGGRTELVYWGLISNVGGAALAFLMMAALSRWVREGHRGFAVLATVAATASMYTNTRSSIAIGLASIAIGIVALQEFRHLGWKQDLRLVAGRIGIVAGLAILLTAPLLLSMARFTDLYYFVNFMFYESFEDIRLATTHAVSPVVGLATIGGIVAVVLFRRISYGAIVALTLVFYASFTILFSLQEPFNELIQQLESPRLMPFQRLLMIYLAAWFAGWVLGQVTSVMKTQWREWLAATVLVALSVIVMLGFYNEQFGNLSEPYQQPPQMTTGVAEYASYHEGIDALSALAPEGTAVMVVGDQESWWHEQLWAPAWSDRMFLYDDWMWFWHQDHEGPYNPEQGHAYLDPALAFTREWFDAHGVGAVLVTNMPVPAGAQDPRHAAATNPLLQYQESFGYWDLYLVADPVTMVTNGETNATTVTTDGGLIEATFADGTSGEIEIRRNWFPRWEAWADGEPVEIERTDNGYMRVTVPEGTTSIELRYGVTPVDWLGRMLGIAGFVGLIALAIDRPRQWWSVFSTPASASVGTAPTDKPSTVEPTPLETARTGLLQVLGNRAAIETDTIRKRTSARRSFLQALAFRSNDLESRD